MIKVVIHYTCKSSYKIFKALKDTPGVEFEVAKTPYFTYLKRYVVSVPAVFYNDELTLLDPVEPSDVVTLRDGKNEKELPIEEAVENFIKGVLASQALLTITMLYKSIKPILDPQLVAVLSRAKYHRQEAKTPQILEKLRKDDGEIIKEKWDILTKSLTFGLVRELYWLGIDIDSIEKPHVKMWLLAKATVGRLGLPTPTPTVPEDVADAVYKILRDAGRRYLDKIAEEQKTIQADVEYNRYTNNINIL
ncbi:MAG: thioredoxin [Pyrobaculum sp.]